MQRFNQEAYFSSISTLRGNLEFARKPLSAETRRKISEALKRRGRGKGAPAQEPAKKKGMTARKAALIGAGVAGLGVAGLAAKRYGGAALAKRRAAQGVASARTTDPGFGGSKLDNIIAAQDTLASTKGAGQTLRSDLQSASNVAKGLSRGIQGAVRDVSQSASRAARTASVVGRRSARKMRRK